MAAPLACEAASSAERVGTKDPHKKHVRAQQRAVDFISNSPESSPGGGDSVRVRDFVPGRHPGARSGWGGRSRYSCRQPNLKEPIGERQIERSANLNYAYTTRFPETRCTDPLPYEGGAGTTCKAGVPVCAPRLASERSTFRDIAQYTDSRSNGDSSQSHVGMIIGGYLSYIQTHWQLPSKNSQEFS